MQPEQQPTSDNNDQPRPQDAYQPQPQPTQPTQPQSQPEQQQPVQSTPSYQATEPATQYVPTQPVEQTPQYAPTQPVNAQHTAEDPGKVFSILGIVAAFIFMQLPGLILSIIGYKKSKKAGHKTTLGTIGIWLNSIGLVLSTLAIAFFVWAAYTGVQQRASDQTLENNAMTVMKQAEKYSALNSDGKYAYPTIEQLQSEPSEGEDITIKDTDQPTGDEIGYKTCSDPDGTIIGANVYIYSEMFRQAVHHGSVGGCDFEG